MALDGAAEINEIFDGLIFDNADMNQDEDTRYAGQVLFAGFLVKMAMILKDPKHQEAIRRKINAVNPEEIKKIKAQYLKGALIEALEELGYQNLGEAISSGDFGILTLQGRLIANAIARHEARTQVQKAA